MIKARDIPSIDLKLLNMFLWIGLLWGITSHEGGGVEDRAAGGDDDTPDAFCAAVSQDQACLQVGSFRNRLLGATVEVTQIRHVDEKDARIFVQLAEDKKLPSSLIQKVGLVDSRDVFIRLAEACGKLGGQFLRFRTVAMSHPLVVVENGFGRLLKGILAGRLHRSIRMIL